MALVERSAFDIWCDFIGPFNSWAHRFCSSAEDAILRQRLPSLDWELYVVAYLTGSMENCGSFADAAGSAAGSCADDAKVLEAGLARFGCVAAASLVQACVALRRDFDQAPGWNDDFEARRNAIESKEDWSYQNAVAYLVGHSADYSFAISPFCRLDPGDTLSLVP